MKSHKSFYICWALLFSFGSAQNVDNDVLIEHLSDVDNLANDEVLINRIFKPSMDGRIGLGSFAFTYKGILLPIKKQIAMKFTLKKHKNLAETEYEMYSYLRAINSSAVECFGIPAVYYYGEWLGHDLIMMGLTLLDKEVHSDEVVKSEINVLIVLRDFILTSKYVHSCNVRHDDVKLENLMILKSRTFLIDFNVSHKLNMKSTHASPPYQSRRALINGHQYPKDDWESFLYSMCDHLNVKFQWDGMVDTEEILRKKKNIDRTIEKINGIRSEKLKDTFISLGVHILDDGGHFESDEQGNSGENSFYQSNPNVKDRFPDYDLYYKHVNDEIEASDSEKPVMFSWLKGTAKVDAIRYLTDHPIPDITKIERPTNQNYYKVFKYPTVDKEYFTRAYQNWKPDASNIMSSSSTEYARSSSGKKARID